MSRSFMRLRDLARPGGTLPPIQCAADGN